MSTRACIQVLDANLQIYKHCDGYDIIHPLYECIKQKKALDDPEYFSAVLFRRIMLFEINYYQSDKCHTPAMSRSARQ